MLFQFLFLFYRVQRIEFNLCIVVQFMGKKYIVPSYIGQLFALQGAILLVCTSKHSHFTLRIYQLQQMTTIALPILEFGIVQEIVTLRDTFPIHDFAIRHLQTVVSTIYTAEGNIRCTAGVHHIAPISTSNPYSYKSHTTHHYCALTYSKYGIIRSPSLVQRGVHLFNYLCGHLTDHILSANSGASTIETWIT